MEAFRIEQELASAARHDAQHARMVREENEKMHREKQKAKVDFILYSLCSSVLMTILQVNLD